MKRCCFADLDGMTASDRWFNDQSEPQFSSRSWRVGAGGASSLSIDAAAVSPDGEDDVGHRSGLVLESVSMAVSVLLVRR